MLELLYSGIKAHAEARPNKLLALVDSGIQIHHDIDSSHNDFCGNENDDYPLQEFAVTITYRP